jgi:alpha-L-arabinofuranosidase
MVSYLNAPADTPWGKKRAENGHPRPYHLRFLEIGNEEATNEHYLERFKLLEPAIHRADPSMQLVIAAWWEPANPVTRQIVQELDGRAALWDVHVGGDSLSDGPAVDQLFTEMQRLVQEWAPDTKLKACVFEENGGRHDLQRALGHARILNATQRHGDFVLMDCPANALQPLGQNDNGWDQGQMFFTPAQVWGMPPYYAQQMAAENHLPLRVASDGTSPGDALDVVATRSEDGKTLVLQVVNASPEAHTARVSLSAFTPGPGAAHAWTLTGDLKAVNTPAGPDETRPRESSFTPAGERFEYVFEGHSYTILRLEAKRR